MKNEKPVKPRKMFAPVTGRFVWAEYASATAKGARQNWCVGSGETWEQWREKRPELRVIHITVTEGWAND